MIGNSHHSSFQGGFSGFGFGTAFPYVHQPVAISEFPKDVWYGTVSSVFEVPQNFRAEMLIAELFSGFRSP